MVEGVWLRKATVLDVMLIVAIGQGAAGAPQWNEALWRRTLEEVDEPRREVLVAESVVGLCGFIVASVVADVAELESVVVAETARRNGVGRELCDRVMDWAEECGAKEMELEVRASNGAAQALYRALGFVVQGRRARYYSEPDEDAILMAARL